MASRDYYIILGISRGAAQDEIKKAYRRLAVHWHPDRNPGSRLAEEKFKAIAEAYAVLGNPGRRRQYDILGPSEFKNEFSHEEIFQGFEPGDFFKFFGLTEAREALDRLFNPNQTTALTGQPEESRARISDFFAGFGQKNSPRDPRSPDIAIALLISLKEAAFGAEKFVAYNTPGGAVKAPVSVPPGADSGRKIVVKGRGPAKPGGQPGDIIVTLTVAPDPVFRRRGSDLMMTLELTDQELADGCRPLVTALSGQSLRLKIPPGSAAGAVFKLRNYGLNKPDGHKGDLLVQLKKK